MSLRPHELFLPPPQGEATVPAHRRHGQGATAPDTAQDPGKAPSKGEGGDLCAPTHLLPLSPQPPVETLDGDPGSRRHTQKKKSSETTDSGLSPGPPADSK